MLHCTCPISQSFGPWPLAKNKTKHENVKMTQCCKPGLRLAKRPHARHRHKMFSQCQTGPPCPLAQPGKHQVIIVKGKFSLSQRWTVKLCDSPSEYPTRISGPRSSSAKRRAKSHWVLSRHVQSGPIWHGCSNHGNTGWPECFKLCFVCSLS